MKNVSFFLQINFLGFFLLSLAWKLPVYQVISAHPHDLKVVNQHVETVLKEGRLWLVMPHEDAPKEVFNSLKMVSGREKSYHYTEPKNVFKYFKASDLIIENLLKNVDSHLIKLEVEEFSRFKSRAAGTEDNRRVTQLISDKFRDLGYEVNQLCYEQGTCSLVAEKKGEVDSRSTLLILGHLDSVGKSFAGADDNASGTAVLLEMARVLKSYKNKKTLRFLATNGEELGLLGAKHYVSTLEEKNLLKDIKLAINMDMVGYNKNGIVELETNPSFEKLAKWFSQLALRFTKLKTKITLGAWGSDHVPFLEAGVSTILTIEDWNTKTPCYHQACDLPETLNYEYASEIAKLNIAAIMTKDLEN